ncbi:HAD family hydrolase [Alkalicoccus daliensis]|uniref:Cof-type HAD-IIB family hydrolase n=1 Tax=Alkalicoccus daliensis TaxID=745820 RepID=A0A1H0JWP1_9BACI|nr:HAD family hydrolase [Alkalicoccus daliensis]SDO47821.1 hypothetical protein SAMN04488053_1159 [Alkalicoccus daliensis]
MTNNAKAIFLDMDGTILNHQNKVSIETKKIIDSLRKQGKYVFIATGRAAGEIEELVPAGFEVDGIISSNGMIGHIEGLKLYKHSLSMDLVEQVIQEARTHGIYYELFPYDHPRITLAQDREYMKKEIMDPKPEDVGMNEWLSRKQAIAEDIHWTKGIQGEEFSKFYCFARTKSHIDSWKSKLEELKKELPFSTSISSPFNVEIMVADVNKATGIQKMLEHFKLDRADTLAIGDSNNDLPMFEYVNYAVAMKNASAEIQEIADEVTAFSCDEEGISHFFQNYLAAEKK